MPVSTERQNWQNGRVLDRFHCGQEKSVTTNSSTEALVKGVNEDEERGWLMERGRIDAAWAIGVEQRNKKKRRMGAPGSCGPIGAESDQ
jgi:hypothetical protein